MGVASSNHMSPFRAESVFWLVAGEDIGISKE